jgi:hypothetical protein
VARFLCGVHGGGAKPRVLRGVRTGQE